MSREKDFRQAAERLADTKRTEPEKVQCISDCMISAEYGYQYAVDKAAKWIGSHLLSSWQGEYLNDFRKAMEE